MDNTSIKKLTNQSKQLELVFNTVQEVVVIEEKKAIVIDLVEYTKRKRTREVLRRTKVF